MKLLEFSVEFMNSVEKSIEYIKNPETGWWIYIMMGIALFAGVLIITVAVGKFRKWSKNKTYSKSSPRSTKGENYKWTPIEIRVSKTDNENRESEEDEDSDDEEIKTTEKSLFVEEHDDKEDSDMEFNSDHITNKENVGEMDTLAIRNKKYLKVIKEIDAVSDIDANDLKISNQMNQ